jgi:hypothetical protein
LPRSTANPFILYRSRLDADEAKERQRPTRTTEELLDYSGFVTSGPAGVSVNDVFAVNGKCPEGVPQEIWDTHLAGAHAYIAEWNAGIAKHNTDTKPRRKRPKRKPADGYREFSPMHTSGSTSQKSLMIEETPVPAVLENLNQAVAVLCSGTGVSI